MSKIPDPLRERIEAVRQQQLKELDLGNEPFGETPTELRLTSIPSEIFHMEHLESLNLRGNRITEVPARIGELRNLKVLNLSFNQLKALPNEIGLLSNLTKLDLSGNNLTSIAETLGELRNLTTLSLWVDRKNPIPVPQWLSELKGLVSIDLVGFGLSHFPDWINQKSKLKILNLSRNHISDIPEWVAELQSLTTLWLAHNRLTGVPESISLLHRLRYLSLSGNKITKFPAPILGLANLIDLNLTDNQLETLPAEIRHLRQLRTLDLNGNRLTTIPDSIAVLPNLDYLGLGGNLLTTVPNIIYSIPQLRWLDLSRGLEKGNQIKEISTDLLRLEKLENLYIQGNPIEIPPPEIAGKGLEAIREYFRQLTAEGTDHLYEAKLLIVGEGGAGKTTLAKKLIDPGYQLREEDSTRGIDVARWQFPLDNGRIFQVNIWDFGGQEIYHATHQFFLTKRSLYALVADTRKEDTDFHYWLNVTELLSDNSPILIIKNEKQDRHREVDERTLRGQFTNLKETLATNLATGRGLDKVLQEVRHQISHLPHVGTPLPKTWVRVREALEQDPRNYISLEEYLSICEEQGFAGLKARLQLSEYLHDLGVCLHFQDDPILKKTVILKPKWGTDAVYRVLDNPRVISSLGRFTRDDLAHIWDEPEHAAMQDELLQLMMKFKLCYPLPGVPGTYIAPQLLSVKQPDFAWEAAENLLLRYTYEFMPKGILTQFIVAMHALIAKQRLAWKSGVVLSKDKTLAEIREHYDRREIRIRVAGKHRKELLVIVTHELDKIHASYPPLKYSKLVPCNCTTCKSNPEPHFYDLTVLRKFVEDRQSRIQCQRSYEMVDVLGLVDDVVGREQLVTAATRIESASAEEVRPQFLFQGTVEQVVVQQTSGGENALRLTERRGTKLQSGDIRKSRSAWANGLFYLFAFVVVIAALGFLARTVPAYVLPMILVAGAIFVPLIGALQLRMDERLADKPFLELMKLVVGQLPLIRRMSKK